MEVTVGMKLQLARQLR